MMKRICSLVLLLGMLLCLLSLVACDNAPGEVTIDGNELLPNEKNDTTTPGVDDVPERDGGIGDNQPVDLPYLPV